MEAREPFGSEQFDRFRQLVYQLTGVTIDHTRRSMLSRRLKTRMRAIGVSEYDAYYNIVLQNKPEQDLFVDRVTTHETRFFRTPRVWVYLQDTLLPEHHATSSEPFRVWSAATSTGEEAYSLAMLLLEYQRQHSEIRFQIDASDISERTVESARQGHYGSRNLNRLQCSHPELHDRYFTEQDEGGIAGTQLRQAVRFFSHNLFDPPPCRATYHLVMLRNVLIYFSNADQERVLTSVFRTLKPGGILIIGESESLSRDNRQFQALEPFIYQAVPGGGAITDD